MFSTNVIAASSPGFHVFGFAVNFYELSLAGILVLVINRLVTFVNIVVGAQYLQIVRRQPQVPVRGDRVKVAEVKFIAKMFRITA